MKHKVVKRRFVIGNCWVHPCPVFRVWVIRNERVRHPEDCRRSWRWKEWTARWVSPSLASRGDAAYLTRIEKELHRKGMGSIYLPIETECVEALLTERDGST